MYGEDDPDQTAANHWQHRAGWRIEKDHIASYFLMICQYYCAAGRIGQVEQRQNDLLSE